VNFFHIQRNVFILFCLFATSIFHLRTGLWLAPFDVSYCVHDIYRDQYFDSREQTSRSSAPIRTAVLHKSCYLNSLWHAAKWLVRLVACTEGAIN
jgi:hypothetical protein